MGGLLLRTCPASGKVQFRTERDAQIAVLDAVLAHNRGRGNRREQRHYQCPSCHWWHLTSQARPGGRP